MESILSHIIAQKTQSQHYRQGILAGFIGSPTFSPTWSNRLDDSHLFKTQQLSQKKRYKAHLQNLMIGASPNSSLWHLDWLDDYYLKQEIHKQCAHNTPCMIVAFDPLLDYKEWLERDYPGQCTYQLYDHMILRAPSVLKELFSVPKHTCIYLSEEHFIQLGSAIRTCGHYLPAGSSISVYFKYRNSIKMRYFKQMLAIWNADLMNVQISCEQAHTYCNIPRMLLSSAYSRFTKRAFFPKKHLWTRMIGLMGLSLLDGVNLVGHLLALVGFTPKKKITSSIAHFRKM